MLVLVPSSVLVNLVLLYTFGILHGGDTPRYIGGAADLLAGHPFQGKESSYIGYVVVVAVSQWLGVGARGIVVFQIGVAALAAVVLYDMGRQLAGHLAGLLAAGLFVVNVDIARWHLYVLTDSLYISLVILSTWCIDRAAERGKWWYACAAPVVLCTAFLRPNGWILVPITVIYWICRATLRRPVKWMAGTLVLLVFLGSAVFISALRGSIQAENPEVWLRQGVVVWGYNGWRVPMPSEMNPAEPGWVEAIGYGLRHPWASLRLAASRVAAELFHVRPFYRIAHNAAVAAALLFVYPLAALGYARCRRAPLAHLGAIIIWSHLLIVALTIADWDGRFLLYIFPLIGLFAACEAAARVAPKLTLLSARIPGQA
jgi:4-amino-4-deoxy-L-arabinose transferase-like glycosyltransferase